jgi:hypothetical protein
MIQNNLKNRLMVLRDTLRRALLADGLGRMALALTIGALAAVLLDFFFFFRPDGVNTVFRCLMLAGVAGVVAAVFYRRVLSPLRVPLSIDDMALSVEKEFPQLKDSLISTVQLTRMMADDRTISAPMVEEVARNAHQETAALEFGRVVKMDRLRPVLFGAGAALLVFLALLAVPATGGYLRVGLLRLVNPFSQTKYPQRTFITVKADEKVPRNDKLIILAEVSGALPSYAYIRFDEGNGFGKREMLKRGEDGGGARRFEYEYTKVIRDFKYRIEAGDSESDKLVSMIELPELNTLQVSYTLPAYTGVPEKPYEPAREIRGVEGTRAMLRGEANKPLKTAEIVIGKEAPALMELSSDRKTFSYAVELKDSKDREYVIKLTDLEGYRNTSEIKNRIAVLGDALPRSSWRAPATDLELTPTASVALEAHLEDDWGLQKAGIHYVRHRPVAAAPAAAAPAAAAPAAAAPAAGGGQNVPPPVMDVSPPLEGSFELPSEAFSRSAKSIDLAKTWNLAELALLPGDVIDYWADPFDWCPTPRKPSGNPQVYHIRILSKDDIKRNLDIERLRLIDKLKYIIEKQELDKSHVEGVKKYLGDDPNGFEMQRAKVSEAGVLQEEVRRKTQELQNDVKSLMARYAANDLDNLDDTKKMEEISTVLGEEHSVKMPDASKEISAAAMVKQEQARPARLEAASKKQEEILVDLRELLQKMEKWADAEELLRLTRELLLKQREISAKNTKLNDVYGAKKPSELTKDQGDEIKQVSLEQRDRSLEMKALYEKMVQAFAKMNELDKFAAKNIKDAFAIAQNAEATLDKLDSGGGESIEDKMKSAQSRIASHSYSAASADQKASEAALERIILVLTRRRDVDKELMKEISQARKDMDRALEKQKELTQKTKNIENKEHLQKNLANAKKSLEDIQKRQKDLKDQTENLKNTADPKAEELAKSLEEASKELKKLIAEENAIAKDTNDAMSGTEKLLADSIRKLEDIEAEERKLAKESAALSDAQAENVLKQQHEKIKKLRNAQAELKSKTNLAENAADKALGAAALKANKDAQKKLQAETSAAQGELKAAAEQMDKAAKDAGKDSPQAAANAAAAKALQQAASTLGGAPEDMQQAADKLGEAKGKDALASQGAAGDKLSDAEQALAKALGLQQKQFEDASSDAADRQTQTRGKLDEVADTIAKLAKASKDAKALAEDPQLAAAGKGSEQAMPELLSSSKDMSDAFDDLKAASGKGDPNGAGKTAKGQTEAADKIAKARAALQAAAAEMAKGKAGGQAAQDKLGERQGQAQGKAEALQKQIAGLNDAISKALSAASGQPNSGADSAAAAQKMGEAAGHMDNAKKDLGKPDMPSATKNEANALDALTDAQDKLGDLKRKLNELQDPARRLERMQKELKDEARKLSTDVAKIEDQLPKDDKGSKDAKAAEKIKNASNNMQNAQNNLSNQGKKPSDSKGGDPKGGDSKGGDSKGGDPKGGDDSKPDSKEAVKEQEQALSELEKALKALEELAAKVAKEPENREKAALKQLQKPQTAVRDDVLKLKKKMDELKDKTGNKNAEEASKSTKKASDKQSEASGEMGKGGKSSAQEDEEEAEKELEEAIKNLDDLAKDMQQQNRQEQLFQIEQELKKMVAAEKDVLGRTQEVEKLRPGADQPLPRKAKLQNKGVAEDQQKINDAATEIVKKLEEAPVFQWVLQTAKDDMSEAVARLKKEETGVATQEIEEDVIKKLSDLIEALRKERNKPDKGGGGGGGGGGKQPLVPPLAELRMLKIMQRDVNARTKKIDEDVRKTKDTGSALNKDQKDRLRRTALKEGEIARITNKIADDLTNGGPMQKKVTAPDDEKPGE